MALSEFSLIERYFSVLTEQRADVVLGIGDDCALLQCPPDHYVAVSIDTLVSGVHFFADVDPENLGYKSLAVGLSDLAAMAAKPAWFTLALTLPEANEAWLQAFAQGLASIASQHNIQLVGGDTTHGPLTISIQVHGLVEHNHRLQRSGAKVGDRIFVSGTLGDAGAALKMRLQNWHPIELDEQDKAFLWSRLERPTPRNTLGLKLAQYANSAIDISDGLLADLGHILERSGKGAVIQLDKLPLSSALQKLDTDAAYRLALSSGDDYELCFTVPAALAAEAEANCDDVTCIGEITAGGGITVMKQDEEVSMNDIRAGYDHFSA